MAEGKGNKGKVDVGKGGSFHLGQGQGQGQVPGLVPPWARVSSTWSKGKGKCQSYPVGKGGSSLAHLESQWDSFHLKMNEQFESALRCAFEKGWHKGCRGIHQGDLDV
jgi:hypothetical protein